MAFVIPGLLALIAVRDSDLNAAAWALGITGCFGVAIIFFDHEGLAPTMAVITGATSAFEGYTQRQRMRE